jgi:FkbM family methyltransferase
LLATAPSGGRCDSDALEIAGCGTNRTPDVRRANLAEALHLIDLVAIPPGEGELMREYRSAVLGELRRARLRRLTDNYDVLQRGPEPPAPPPIWRACAAEAMQRVKDEGLSGLRPLARALAYYLAPGAYFSRYASAEIERGELLYGLLADEPSRGLLVKLIAYRILGHRKVKLPRNTPRYWRDIEAVGNVRTDAEPIPIKFMDAKLALYDCTPMDYDLRAYASGPGLACALVQKQYEYHWGDVHLKAEAGDVVIDAGGCWGETSVYFAHEVGAGGAVISFEFIPSNLVVLHRNREANPHLKDRLRVVENPIWSASGLKLYYVDWGPGSRVTADINQYHSWEGIAETTTIDDTLAAQGLDRVDFIKMDIEGAELDALKGAEAAIRKHRPKLAISLYHKPDDFETIPSYLDGLGLGYRFYLDHHTIYENETVLFAVTDQPWKQEALYVIDLVSITPGAVSDRPTPCVGGLGVPLSLAPLS